MDIIDAWVAACLLPLAIVAVLSGIDDLILDMSVAWGRLRRRRPEAGPGLCPEKRMAVFVPLWQEHDVITRMLRHNLSAIRYSNYDVFVGCYPNDSLTLEAVREIEALTPNIHLTIVPHDGPTSKADCLNWIYQAMLAHEEACGSRFELVVTHDAEDVIHPEGLSWINYYLRSHDMVQIPVLPLPTPGHRLTHGVYCDEFAEFQTKDVPARRMLGGFLPSNGVGTGYSRRALEALASAAANRLFDPECLTEDYDCGIRLHRLGFRQYFIPIQFLEGQPVATREYFPRRFRQAVRQRTRWVTGIALQGWERHGWRGGLGVVYWFWRDRKGLLGNPLSLLANLVSVYGMATLAWAAATGRPWGLAGAVLAGATGWLLAVALISQGWRILVRMVCSGRIYGWGYAAGVPARVVWANWMNAIATALAVVRYTRARLGRRSHAWLKTEHTYPALETASRRQVLPLARIDPAGVRRETARALPLHVVERWKVLPCRINEGRLLLATPQEPPPGADAELSRFTSLQICFQIVSPEDFERLLGAAAVQVR